MRIDRLGSGFRAGLAFVRRARPFVLVAVLVSGSLPAHAEDGPEAPSLAAASSFGRGWRAEWPEHVRAAGIGDFRDAIYWERVEREPGRYDFSRRREKWPDAFGAVASLTVNWGHPLYQNGETPTAPDAVDAFARFAAAAVERYPNVEAIEVGNEFNGTNFVRGPLEKGSPEDRAKAHLAMLRATHDAVKAVRPDVDVLGGATHSMPLGYLWSILDAGGAEFMDALAVHPYTTAPEHLPAQVALLRRHEAARDLPLQVTEFGSQTPGRAADHLMKMMCAMSMSGVERAAWYPLHDAGDGHVPLLDGEGEPTEAGRAYAFAEEAMAGRAVRDVSPDPFSRACLFDDTTLVIWGAERSVEIADGLRALDAQGREVDGPLTLSREGVLVIEAEAGLEIGRHVVLGESGVLADSFLQFDYPGGDAGESGGFERFVRRDGERLDLETMPGQERQGAPWVPYLANAEAGGARVLPRRLLPGGNATSPAEIVHRYTASETGAVSLSARVSPARRSTDGVTVRIERNGEVLEETILTEPHTFEMGDLKLVVGDTLDIVIGPNRETRGDAVDYRFTLSRARRAG